MTSIITGDIIHSKNVKPETWLPVLKSELISIGPNPLMWEIYRGDSFQIEVEDVAKALDIAIKIKASIKCIKGIDVRMAIGIGQKSYTAAKITESNGSAFVYSGELFEQFSKNMQTLAVASASKKFDSEVNLMLRLALIAMDNWLIIQAQTVKAALENPGLSQKELGEKLGIKQNAVSSRLKRAYFDEIKALSAMYKVKIKEFYDYFN
jgi:predicted XRE-type DNA-binding protein